MKTKALCLLTLFTLEACDGGPLFVPNEITSSEQKSHLAGENATDCGYGQDWKDEVINQCVGEAFQQKQPFMATFITSAVFIGTNDSYAFDGEQLYLIKGNSVACSGKTQEECNYYYRVYECIDPTFVTIDERAEYLEQPFTCLEEALL